MTSGEGYVVAELPEGLSQPVAYATGDSVMVVTGGHNVEGDASSSYKVDVEYLWSGDTVVPGALDKVELLVCDDLELPDLMGTPISWFICSSRLIRAFSKQLADNAQILTAPTFSVETQNSVKDFYILNVTTVVRAVNRDQSKMPFSEKGDLIAVGEFVFDREIIPDNAHIFRVEEYKRAVIVSDTIKKIAEDENLAGLYFIPCRCVKSNG